MYILRPWERAPSTQYSSHKKSNILEDINVDSSKRDETRQAREDSSLSVETVQP
jgi:hypothetical protein